MVHLGDIQGLWRRQLILSPEGEADTTTEVFWLQGPQLYADLRIPAGRPSCSATCLRELDWTILQFLSRQEGFFGHLDVENSIGHWHRTFDYQPATGRADRGYLAFEGSILSERGVESPYVERWLREPGGEEVLALSLTMDDRIGALVVAGPAFMFAKSRGRALPAGVDLTDCIGRAASLMEAQDLFDCEISFGSVRAGKWLIERSSLPFREGVDLRAELDEETGTLSVCDVMPDGAPVRRPWHITASESTSPDRALSSWFAPRQPKDIDESAADLF